MYSSRLLKVDFYRVGYVISTSLQSKEHWTLSALLFLKARGCINSTVRAASSPSSN